jgi:hypothetical protein
MQYNQEFRNPPALHRGAPFWSWNTKLEQDKLLRQIGIFKEMGMGGVHIHCRTGLDTEYLGGEFMDCVKVSVEKAKELGLYVYLYDEDRYSSGYAGGLVTKDPSFRKRWIEWTSSWDGTGELLASYQVAVSDGFLTNYIREKAGIDGKTAGKRWFAVKRVAEADPWYNNQTEVDTLNPEATMRFIRLTHERYKECIGNEFGRAVPSIFTDEPKFAVFVPLTDPVKGKSAQVPYTDDLPGSFEKEYGFNLFDKLPELFWNFPDNEIPLFRYQYRNHTANRFAESYAGILAGWCKENGIALTGHFMSEATLDGQAGSGGSIMRSLRFLDIPGMDLLCDGLEYLTAKQAQSIAHQYGRKRMMCEPYGVTNWDFDFKGHKMQGDWQAALGVTLRVHHHAWVSMAGEGKRDFPASIGYQSPWYQEYKVIEDHFARINVVMGQGNPLVKIAIIHPIESYWMAVGPIGQTYSLREELENDFSKLIEWSLLNFLDFDLIDEGVLPGLCGKGSFPLEAGKMAYEAVVVPPSVTLRKTTVRILNEFRSAGGLVISVGRQAAYLDGSKAAETGLSPGMVIGMSKGAYLDALEPLRFMDIRFENGLRPDNLICRIQENGGERYVFIAHTVEKRHRGGSFDKWGEPALVETVYVSFKGLWEITLYDTLTGETSAPPSKTENNETLCAFDLSLNGSLLLGLSPVKEKSVKAGAVYEKTSGLVLYCRLDEPEAVTAEEPNVLPLDMAQYQLDGGAWREKDDILHINTVLRDELSYPNWRGLCPQPWTDKTPDIRDHRLTLGYELELRAELKNLSLALENVEENRVIIDGREADREITGWYVDEDIKTIKLPDMGAGNHRVEIIVPYGKKAALEVCYLLGDFSVHTAGAGTWIEKRRKKINYGDAAAQGYSFYGGNLRYDICFDADGRELILHLPRFSGALCSVWVDGKQAGRIMWAPNQLRLGKLKKGAHRLGIRVYGNRYNTFGQLHNCDPGYTWFGPSSWYTTGSRFSAEYQLKPFGLLTAPILWAEEKV